MTKPGMLWFFSKNVDNEMFDILKSTLLYSALSGQRSNICSLAIRTQQCVASATYRFAAFWTSRGLHSLAAFPNKIRMTIWALIPMICGGPAIKIELIHCSNNLFQLLLADAFQF